MREPTVRWSDKNPIATESHPHVDLMNLVPVDRGFPSIVSNFLLEKVSDAAMRSLIMGKSKLLHETFKRLLKSKAPKMPFVN